MGRDGREGENRDNSIPDRFQVGLNPAADNRGGLFCREEVAIQTIGLIGGTSWESTAVYYRVINETVREERGGLHSAKIVLLSVDFQEFESLQSAGQWEAVAAALAAAGKRVTAAGADFLVLCANTLHKVAPAVEAALDRPLLHIVDVTAEAVREAGVNTVGLLGTRFTMEERFYRARLTERHGLEVLVPDEAERETVHAVIFEELCRGEVRDASRARLGAIVGGLAARGAEAVVLGCTELGLLIGPGDATVPIFDSAVLHARAAARRALSA